MSPETAIAWGEWRLLARDIRQFIAGLRAGTQPFTPTNARLLEANVSALAASGEIIFKELAHEAGSVVSATSHVSTPVPEVQPEPRMLHDMEGVYLPETNRGWLKDMGRPNTVKRGHGKDPGRPNRQPNVVPFPGGRS